MTTQTPVMGDTKLLDGLEMSEPGNAERLIAIARGQVHFVDSWGTWIAYRDGKWELDGSGVGLQAIAKQVPQSIFMGAASIKPSDSVLNLKESERTLEEAQQVAWYNLHIVWARKSNTEPSIKRMISLARDLPGVRITHEDLDANPFLLNLQNGTFNFKNNTFHPHNPLDLITKMAQAWYDPTATHEVWDRCLRQWQPDGGIRTFLQEITGSGLIGEAVQNLFVNVGSGRNGKGTFYKQIQIIMGNYAGTAPEEMLVETRFKVHDEEKARLRGCRLLIAPETSVGDRLDEAGIKNLTGGDMIHGRHLYGRPFEFKPTHTAFLHTNYEPHIRGTDAAIWNRVIKIPWDTYIKEEDRDTSIDYKLEAERSGILNWLIIGCIRWIATGLKAPPSIKSVTEQYRAEQDTIGRFLADEYDNMVAQAANNGATDYIPAGLVRRIYEEWCISEGIKPWSTQSVSRELKLRGWEHKQKKVGKQNIKIWEPSDVTGVTAHRTKVSENPESSVTSEMIIDQALLSPSILVSDETRLISTGETTGNEVIERVNKKRADTGYSDTNDDVPWTDEERERDEVIRHREWLHDHGYPVPPTEEELARYYESQYLEAPNQEGT